MQLFCWTIQTSLCTAVIPKRLRHCAAVLHRSDSTYLLPLIIISAASRHSFMNFQFSFLSVSYHSISSMVFSAASRYCFTDFRFSFVSALYHRCHSSLVVSAASRYYFTTSSCHMLAYLVHCSFYKSKPALNGVRCRDYCSA
jgi:hypothetical protein